MLLIGFQLCGYLFDTYDSLSIDVEGAFYIPVDDLSTPKYRFR